MNNTLHEVFVELLSDLYDAENQIVAALPKLIGMSTENDLTQALTDHLEQTKMHVERLNTIAKDLSLNLAGRPSKITKASLADGEVVVNRVEEPIVKDAALVAAAQKVEHYEIAGYGTAAAWAKTMKHDGAA